MKQIKLLKASLVEYALEEKVLLIDLLEKYVSVLKKILCIFLVYFNGSIKNLKILLILKEKFFLFLIKLNVANCVFVRIKPSVKWEVKREHLFKQIFLLMEINYSWIFFSKIRNLKISHF